MHSFRYTSAMRLAITLLLVTAAVGVTNAQQQDETYVVRFPNSAKVGERTKETLRAEQVLSRKILDGEKVLFNQEDTTVIEFDSVVEVLEVNDRGQQTKCRYTVERAVVKADGTEIPLLPEGTVFIAEAGEEQTTFTKPDGQELPEAARRTLPRIIAFDTEELTMDDLFGSDTPRKVGESWKADTETLLEMAKQNGANADEDGVEGTAKLVAAREKDGETLLDLEIKTEYKKMTTSSPIPTAEPVSAEVIIEQKTTKLADPTKGPLSQSHKMTIRQVLKGKEGTQMAGQTLDGSTSETRSVTYEKLPDAEEGGK